MIRQESLASDFLNTKNFGDEPSFNSETKQRKLDEYDLDN